MSGARNSQNWKSHAQFLRLIEHLAQGKWDTRGGPQILLVHFTDCKQINNDLMNDLNLGRYLYAKEGNKFALTHLWSTLWYNMYD